MNKPLYNIGDLLISKNKNVFALIESVDPTDSSVSYFYTINII